MTEVTRAWQLQFIDEMMDSIKSNLRNKIVNGKVPENWDGFELRELLAEKFNQCRVSMPKQRKRDYNNTVVINNL